MTSPLSAPRGVLRQLTGRPTSDGAGVRLTRVFGGQSLNLDPFLMLDEFDALEASDYIGGFPAHPHRGFETVTYMLEGRMRHEDHLGNRGLLEPGGAQWMSAARGIIHSEMPEQTEGRMRGFQLWINLPAKEKMGPAAYRDLRPEELPRATFANGVSVTVVAGVFDDGERRIEGAIQGKSTEANYVDVQLPAGGAFQSRVPASHTALLYVYDGELKVLGGEAPTSVGKGRLAIMGEGETVRLSSEQGARALLLSGKPLNEPVVQYGPFVMNTTEQIEQAMRDYRDGILTGTEPI